MTLGFQILDVLRKHRAHLSPVRSPFVHLHNSSDFFTSPIKVKLALSFEEEKKVSIEHVYLTLNTSHLSLFSLSRELYIATLNMKVN